MNFWNGLDQIEPFDILVHEQQLCVVLNVVAYREQEHFRDRILGGDTKLGEWKWEYWFARYEDYLKNAKDIEHAYSVLHAYHDFYPAYLETV